jgi:predicted metal-dependent phosphoesterase TrpH
METSACGRVKGREVARLYKKAGYDGIVITDHYFKDFFEQFEKKSWEDRVDQFLFGYEEAKREGEQIGLKVLLGAEIRFSNSGNDFLIYGIDEDFLKQNPKLYEMGLEKFKQYVEDRGILIFQAHPFRPGNQISNPLVLDGIEVYNGNSRANSNNDLAYSFAKEKNLRMISGSDFHEIEDLSKGGIIISKNVDTSKTLVKQLNDNKEIEIVMPEGENPFNSQVL